MTEFDATIVTAAGDWQGIYFDGELRTENHNVELADVNLDDDESIGSIEREHYNIKRLGRTTLPETLEKLGRLAAFADTVEENYTKWATTLRDTFESHDKHYIMTDEVDKIFDLEDGEGQVLFALFSKQSVRNKTTPLGKDPLIELDHDNSVSGAGPAAYQLVK